MPWVEVEKEIEAMFARLQGCGRIRAILSEGTGIHIGHAPNKKGALAYWRWRNNIKTGTKNPGAPSASREYYRRKNREWLAAIKADPAKLEAYNARKRSNAAKRRQRC